MAVSPSAVQGPGLVRPGDGAMLCPARIQQLPELPESFLLQLFKQLSQEDIKSLRSTCSRLCVLCVGVNRLCSLKASALLIDAAPTLAHLPPISFLDFNARNADCSHQLLAALRQHGSRLEGSVRAVRLSGRDGLLAALQTLRLACPQIERLEIRCQHSYRGRHKECADLGRCLQELETAFPSLTELHLQRFPISSSQLVHLCDSLLSLKSLSVRGLAQALTSDSLAHLNRLTQLASLSIDHLELQGRSFPCGPQLRSLELSDATISSDSFATLNSLTGLQSLSLWGTGHRAAIAFTPLTALGALRRLHLELVLDAAVLAGLSGCTALASLSAQGARVVVAVGASLGPGGAARDEEAAEAAFPPQLTSVTRLSLEDWSEECLPLAAWVPGLRSLVLEEGDGVWDAVAGHECLTSLRVGAGGSLPPGPGRGAEGARGESEAWRREMPAAAPVGCGKADEEGVQEGCGSAHEQCGEEAVCSPSGRWCAAGGVRGGDHHHHHSRSHSHGHRRHSREHYLGPSASSSGSEAPVGRGRSSSGSSSSGSGSGITDGSETTEPGERGSCSAGSSSAAETEQQSKVAVETAGGKHQAVAAGSLDVTDMKAVLEATMNAGRTAECRAHTVASPCGAPAAGDGSWQLPPQLACLRLGGCEGLSEQDYGSCALLPALTSCNLSGCSGLTPAALVRLLGRLPAVQELSLDAAPHLTDEALACLGSSAGGEGGGATTAAAAAARDGLSVAAPPPPPLAVACAPAVAAMAQAAASATGVPVPPCSACAGMAEAPAPWGAGSGRHPTPGDGGNSGYPAAPLRGGFARSSSAAALAAAAAMDGRCGDAAGIRCDAAGAATALRRLELTRLPLVTARGVAAAAAGLPRLTDLRVASCQAVCREACIWLPQQLGRPYLSVVCSHAVVYDDH